MIEAKIVAGEIDVEERLTRDFGVSRAEFISVVQKTLAERSNTVPHADVAGAAGSLAYIHGSRHLRLLLLSKGYLKCSEKNVESSVHPTDKLKITYQNVDMAAHAVRNPKAISGKKAGSAQIIDEAQGSLFPGGELPEVAPATITQTSVPQMWYFCLSFSGEHGENVRAELSLPAMVKNGNFHGFLERIMIINEDGWGGLNIDADPEDGPIDFDVHVSRIE